MPNSIKNKLEEVIRDADGLLSKGDLENLSKELGHYADTIARMLRKLSSSPYSDIRKTYIPRPDGKRSQLYYYHRYNIKQLHDLERMGIKAPLEMFYDEAEQGRP